MPDRVQLLPDAAHSGYLALQKVLSAAVRTSAAEAVAGHLATYVPSRLPTTPWPSCDDTYHSERYHDEIDSAPQPTKSNIYYSSKCVVLFLDEDEEFLTKQTFHGNELP